MSLFSQTRFAALQQRVADQEKALEALTKAFNAFFDVVAADLGYEAATAWYYHYVGRPYEAFCSPRRLAEIVTPEKREIVHHKTARCRRASTAPSAKEK